MNVPDVAVGAGGNDDETKYVAAGDEEDDARIDRHDWNFDDRDMAVESTPVEMMVLVVDCDWDTLFLDCIGKSS